MLTPLILIVDDKPENLTVLGELLQHRYAVRVANSGVHALRLARQQPQPALMLLDVMMPDMDGHEVLAQLREHPATASMPVVFLTALSDRANVWRGLRGGAADFVSKPIHPELLLARVQSALQAGTAPPVAEPVDKLSAADVSAADVSAAEAYSANVPALQVPGLTMSRALMYLPGRDQLFERVLRQFAQHYRAGLGGLAAALDARNWRAVQGLLHALRGACGAIGASSLLGQTILLEQGLPLDVPPDTPTDKLADTPHPQAADSLAAWALSCRALDAAVVALVASIDAALGPLTQPAPARPAAGDPAALHPAMDALAARLRVADFAAGAAFRVLAPGLLAAFDATSVQAVANALSQHDYDAALLALHGLRHPTGALPAVRKV